MIILKKHFNALADTFFHRQCAVIRAPAASTRGPGDAARSNHWAASLISGCQAFLLTFLTVSDTGYWRRLYLVLFHHKPQLNPVRESFLKQIITRL